MVELEAGIPHPPGLGAADGQSLWLRCEGVVFACVCDFVQ